MGRCEVLCRKISRGGTGEQWGWGRGASRWDALVAGKAFDFETKIWVQEIPISSCFVLFLMLSLPHNELLGGEMWVWGRRWGAEPIHTFRSTHRPSASTAPSRETCFKCVDCLRSNGVVQIAYPCVCETNSAVFGGRHTAGTGTRRRALPSADDRGVSHRKQGPCRKRAV